MLSLLKISEEKKYKRVAFYNKLILLDWFELKTIFYYSKKITVYMSGKIKNKG